MSYKICPACNRKNKAEALICIECGTELSTVSIIDVQEENTKTKIVLILRGENYEIYLDEDKILGRKAYGKEHLQNQYISRQHAKITFEDNKAYIKDLNSTNGTYLNNERIEPNKKYRLRDGDILNLSTDVKLQVIIKRE